MSETLKTDSVVNQEFSNKMSIVARTPVFSGFLLWWNSVVYVGNHENRFCRDEAQIELGQASPKRLQRIITVSM